MCIRLTRMKTDEKLQKLRFGMVHGDECWKKNGKENNGVN